MPRWDLLLFRTGYAFAPADSSFPGLASRAGTPTNPEVVGNDILKQRGVVIDTVLHASNIFDFDSTTLDTIREVWREVEPLPVDSPYPASSQLSVFVGVLTAGTREGDIWDWLRVEAAYFRAIQQKSPHPDVLEGPSQLAAESEDMNTFHNTVKGYTHNRRIIVTKRGYFGLAPAVVKQGDSVGIMFGRTTPCILRPSSGRHPFRYLGAVYVLGKQHWRLPDGRIVFNDILGIEASKDWVSWDVAEQDICLC